MPEFLAENTVAKTLGDFKEKKTECESLAEVYAQIGQPERAHRVEQCGDFLHFYEGKLHRANFCKDRLCPICALNKARRVGAKLIHTIKAIPDRKFVFLTLTVPNVHGERLSDIVQRMFKAFANLADRTYWLSFALGFFRALEVTCDINGMYHPHLHLLVCVTDDFYDESINDNMRVSEKLLYEWRAAMCDGSIADIDVKPVSPLESTQSHAALDYELAVVKVALYCAKTATCIDPNDFERSCDIVETLSRELAGKRFYSDGGIIRKTRQKLEQIAKNNFLAKAEPNYLVEYRFNRKKLNYDNYGMFPNVFSQSYYDIVARHLEGNPNVRQI